MNHLESITKAWGEMRPEAEITIRRMLTDARYWSVVVSSSLHVFVDATSPTLSGALQQAWELTTKALHERIDAETKAIEHCGARRESFASLLHGVP